jgi:hypothetical protein
VRHFVKPVGEPAVHGRGGFNKMVGEEFAAPLQEIGGFGFCLTLPCYAIVLLFQGGTKNAEDGPQTFGHQSAFITDNAKDGHGIVVIDSDVVNDPDSTVNTAVPAEFTGELAV